MFARRTELDLTPNLFAKRLGELRQAKSPLLDLTESNPTQCGIRYPENLLAPLTGRATLVYEPIPQGLLSAREAVASIYAGKGVKIPPDQIFLTASTSEAYAHLFRLVADPGDKILVPRPSYPLFEHLANLNDVQPVWYSLAYQEGTRWRIDFESLRRGITPKTRAVVVVHPNNPTGSCVIREEWEELIQLCGEKKLCLIADEVFAEYLYQPDRNLPATLSGPPECLTFALGGVSKYLGLPQMKLAWTAATGPAPLLHAALERLEWIADTYLSVNTPVQKAFPTWIPCAEDIRSQIRKRLQANREFLLGHLKQPSSSLLAADGGWSAVLRIPSIQDEERTVLELLEQDHLVVYPGYFFDFEETGIIVVSLLPAEGVFQEGIARLIKRLEQKGGPP